MAGGRPTDYDPAHCDTAQTFLADGYSVAALAGHLRVAKSTIYEWMRVHPEFSSAVKTGQAGAALWWEDRLRDIVAGKEGNATSAIFGLKNRAPEEWRDVTRTEHTGADGGAIETKETGEGAAKVAAFLSTIAERSGTTGGSA